jgi:antirestriction protein ArdC
MSPTRAKNRRPSGPPRDIYAEVTGRVLTSLEDGVVPWRRPWRVDRHADSDRYTHVNLASRKPYRGVNTLLLDLTAATAGYTSPYWVTFRQAITLGGAVRRGEQSTMIVFWKQLVIQAEEDGAEKPRRIPLLRHYNVFNIEQCDELTERIPPLPERASFEPIEAARSLLAKMPDPPRVIHGGSHAYYRPALDTVGLPQPESFETREAYYAVSFHEHVHSTGHRRRLARKEVMEIGEFAGLGYSREELVAEMGAAFMCAIADIDVPALQTNTAAYIASWMSKLRDDPKLLISAAGQAQRASDFILGAQRPAARPVDSDPSQRTPLAVAA